MKYRELRQQLTHLQLTGQEFAKLIGLNPRTLSNRAADDPVPEHWVVILTLMTHMAHHHLDFRAPLKQLDPPPSPKRPRGSNIHRRTADTTELDRPTGPRKKMRT